MGSLKVYNTLTKRKEPFRTLAKGRVRMFVCGPTVQGPIHAGHARTYIFYDVVARYLAHLGYKVEFLVNVTDIDERITAAAREERVDPLAFASRYAEFFFEDMNSLGIASVTRFERVSNHVSDAIDLVSDLVRKGRAYRRDGWVYFDTSSFPNFGALSGLTKAELARHPLELSPRKKNLADFSLWRPEVLVDGLWNSPWGLGSPGWHIQDTAITSSVFGPQYDIHGGAYELIYPHHEAEIAQGESISGVSPMVRYWVHTHLVTTEGEKMSKSVGNVYTVRDALRRHSKDELRYYFLLTHYRKDMDLSGLDVAAKRLGELRRKVRRLGHPTPSGGADAASHLGGFLEAMNDDFNTPVAIKELESLVRTVDARPSPGKAMEVLEALELASGILGVDILGKQ